MYEIDGLTATGGPTLGELELLADIREISAERDAALAEVQRLTESLAELRSTLGVAA